MKRERRQRQSMNQEIEAQQKTMQLKKISAVGRLSTWPVKTEKPKVLILEIQMGQDYKIYRC